MSNEPHQEQSYELAGDPRVYFAAERTQLAWIRTGLALMGLGFVVARFGLFLRQWAAMRGTEVPAAQQPDLSLWLGTVMVLLGIGVNVMAGLRHARFERDFARGRPPSLDQGQTVIWLAWLLAALGVAIAGYLIFIAVG